MRTRATGGGSDAAAPSSNDLLVVGPGVLGRLVAAQWKEEHGGAARVVGETATTMNHESLKSLGCFDEVRTREDGSDSTFPYVLFAAPPSGSEDYAAEVERAAGGSSSEVCATRRKIGLPVAGFLFGAPRA